MKNKKNKIITFGQHLEKEYGKKGSSKRDKFESGYESFRLGVIIQELRKRNKITQEQLAKKCGTTKNYISRIENDASDIRLSTFMRIINCGFNGELRFCVNLGKQKKRKINLTSDYYLSNDKRSKKMKNIRVAEKKVTYSSKKKN